MEHPKSFTQTTRGKLILAFVLVLCVSLFTWIFNRSAFDRINNVVEELAQPNERLAALNQLQLGMSRMNDFYRVEALQNRYKPSAGYNEKVNQILEQVARLKLFFEGDSVQIQRLQQVDSVFRQRNALFERYLKMRYNYLHNGLVDKQFEELANQVDRQNLKVDTNVVTSEKETTTYTYYNPVVKPEQAQKEEKKRLFRRKKPEPVVETKPYVVVEKNLNVHVDTLAVSKKKDSILENIRLSLDQVETKRNSGRQFLQKQELILIESNEILFNRVLDLISQVEEEERLSTDANAKHSIGIARETIAFTKILTGLFVLIASILIGFIIGDISKFNRYRKQLEASRAEAEFHSHAKQRFLSNMSHEIRTPLQAIIGYSELMSQENEYDREKMEAISRSSEHLLQVVNEILDYSRIISDKFVIENKPFVLQEVLKEVSELAKFQCEQKGINWSFQPDIFSGPDLVVNADAFRIKQVLINVLSNAVKFTVKGGVSMHVEWKEQNTDVLLSVEISDTGIGMDKHDLSRIFQQFERAKNVETVTGTGLGLSIVKELMDAMKGQVRVKSVPGKGTTFNLDFKLRKELNPQPGLIENLEEPIVLDGVIWVVDDDPFILKLCSQLLEKRKLNYRSFGSPEEVLETEWDAQVKLVFIDMRMPGMSGVELSERLRQRADQPVRIVALTAQVLPEDTALFLEKGFDAIVSKPFKSHEFYLPILELLRDEPLTFDFSVLRTMIPDYSDFEEIKQQFVADSTKDLKTIVLAMESKNEQELVLVVHRLAGRFSQMGATFFGNKLREFELQLKSGITDDMLEQVRKLVPDLEKLIQTI